MARIITLTTDFGLEDEYVGVMKGVILGRAPDLTIVDLSHAVEHQNIHQAALLIASAYRFFPAQTVHLVVVDPGVGSNRKIIVLQADNHIFLAPDNGVLGLLFDTEHFQAAYEVQCRQYFLTPLSATFHGRDIMAPVGAELAAGLDPAAVGPPVNASDLEKLEIPRVTSDPGQRRIFGEIVGRDHFGNLLTNISGLMVSQLSGGPMSAVRISVKGAIITGIQTAYAQKRPGELLAVVGSRGFLEIAVNQGSAAESLGAGIGDAVTVEMRKT